MNNFFYNLKRKIESFMIGRYGIDQLYYAMMVCYVVCIVLNMLFRRLAVVSIIFYIISWLMLILALIRALSKNISQRQAENQKFLYVWNKVKGSFSMSFNKIKDFPEKKYAKCPHCKSDLRLPRIRGKHTVKCPRCNNRFEINIVIGGTNKK